MTEKNLAPKTFHFVWVGGPIPEKYLQPMIRLAEVAKKNNFQLCLWGDDVKNIEKTLEKMNSASVPVSLSQLGVTFRNVNELKKSCVGLKAESFMKESCKDSKKTYGELYWNAIQKEMIGFNNYAAASDLLRYLILYVEGGYYFDTDTYFVDVNQPFAPTPPGEDATEEQEKKYEYQLLDYEDMKENYKNYYHANSDEVKLKPNDLPQGISVHGTMRYDTNASGFDMKSPNGKEENDLKIPKIDLMVGNDLIVALPQHEVMKNCIKECTEQYQKKSSELVSHEEKTTFQKSSTTTKMDAKRYPTMLPIKMRQGTVIDRYSQTLDTAGPGVLARSLVQHWDSLPEEQKIFKNARDLMLPFNSKDNLHQVAQTHVYSNSHKTWAKENVDTSSFDDSELGKLKF